MAARAKPSSYGSVQGAMVADGPIPSDTVIQTPANSTVPVENYDGAVQDFVIILEGFSALQLQGFKSPQAELIVQLSRFKE